MDYMIYPVKVMKVIFSDVTHPPALSSEMPLGSMPSFPDWTTAETLWYPSPEREEKVSHISVTQKKNCWRINSSHCAMKDTTGMNGIADRRGRYVSVTCSYFQQSELCENSQLKCEKLSHHKMTTFAPFEMLDTVTKKI